MNSATSKVRDSDWPSSSLYAFNKFSLLGCVGPYDIQLPTGPVINLKILNLFIYVIFTFKYALISYLHILPPPFAIDHHIQSRLPKTMKAITSIKLAFLIIFIHASGLPFKRMKGLGAQAETYKCKTNADCERQCDPRGCMKNVLFLPSNCVNGLCECPFGGVPYIATKTLPNSTCKVDGDCSKQCPSECNVRSCVEYKCKCGCQGSS